MQKFLEFLFGVLLLLFVCYDISLGNKLNYVHLLFLIFSVAFVLFAISKNKNIMDLISSFNIKRIKAGNFEIEMEKRISEYIKSDLNSINFSSSDINKQYSKELTIAQLRETNMQINFKINNIYDLYYSAYTTEAKVPSILVFEKLRADGVFNPQHCYYIYEYCFITEYILTKISSDSDFHFNSTINDYSINDLIRIGNEIIKQLNDAQVILKNQRNQLEYNSNLNSGE